MFYIDRERCINCGNCIKVCQLGIFHRNEEGAIEVHENPCMDCYHCAAACPTHAVCHRDLGSDACYTSPAPEGTLLAKFQRRRSVRHFKGAPDRAVIESALAGAAYAPSAKNQQACRWCVVLGSDKVEEIRQLALQWCSGQKDFRHLVWLARRGINPITCGAPCLILAHAPKNSHNPQVDAAIATTLAEQLLVDHGLGTCWGGYMAIIADQSPEIRAALAIPEDHVVCSVLMVGIPDEHYPNTPPRSAPHIHWVE